VFFFVWLSVLFVCLSILVRCIGWSCVVSSLLVLFVVMCCVFVRVFECNGIPVLLCCGVWCCRCCVRVSDVVVGV